MADNKKNRPRVRTSVAPKARPAVSRRPSQGQKTTSKASGTRAAQRKAKGASHAKSLVVESAPAPRRATSVGSGNRSARKHTAIPPRASQSAPSAGSGAAAIIGSLKDRLMGNRVALALVGIIIVALLVICVDSLANWGKAYGNVSIGGIEVGGMNADEMHAALDEEIGSKLASSQVTVYASEEAREKAAKKYAREENAATAEQISAEEAQAKTGSWTTDGSALQASIPYDEVISSALEAGRKGGPFGRLAVAFMGKDIPLALSYDAEGLEAFASEIDKAIGEERQDATVVIEDGRASAVEGHDGTIVDRSWLAEKISDVFLERNGATYVIAETTFAPSRTTMEQAEQMRDAVNQALASGVDFKYKKNSWTADATELGNWTKIEVAEQDGTYVLDASIDADLATSALVKNIAGQGGFASGDFVVDFEVSGSEVVVHTSGTGKIPEVVPAVEKVGEALYGANGIAWASAPSRKALAVEIGESDAPESLGLEQARDLGVVSVIGEYTTEFSNDEGTENRNHNIRLVSDILNNTVCESNGGQWSFNDHSGDTNLDPPFASAGSIVNGEYVDSIGGGICQVATTIFNAVYEAGLDVTQRRNHSLYIGSYPTGRDVGVSYPELDFIWENKLASDVLLQLSYTDTSVTAKLYGVYTGYQVVSEEGEWEEGDTYKTDFEEDDTLAKGDYYLKTVGEDGSKVSVTRTVTDKDGNIVSETVFESVYEPKNEVYVIGPGTETSRLVHTAEPKSESPEEAEEEYDEYSEGAYEDDSVYDDAYDYADEELYLDEGTYE